jgi:hypothetical protein
VLKLKATRVEVEEGEGLNWRPERGGVNGSR